MLELLGVGLIFCLFMVLVYIIPIYLLVKFDNEDPKK